ncbi:MAG: hypothetical protein EON92_09725, partial [Burkholderiales bacterium]
MGWNTFAGAGDDALDMPRLRGDWAQLHRGDAEPLPEDPAVLEAWLLFHNGAFEQAAQAGLAAGGDGITVANKA